MLVTVILFGMFLIATGAPTTLSVHNAEYGLRDSYEVQCHTMCQGEVQKRCLRCYRKCWLLKGYRLDSGSITLCN